MESGSIPTTDSDNTQQKFGGSRGHTGTLYGFCSYTATGLLPLYFHMLAPATAPEILVHRIIWSFVFCLGLGLISRNFYVVKEVFRDSRRLGLITAAMLLLALNWMTFIFAVASNNVVESALGEFITPLIVVLLGVVILRERLRALQWFAIGLGVAAVLIVTFDYGRPPWIALSLAASFSLYGLLKKKIGLNVGAIQSMTIETALMSPFAIAVVVWLERSGKNTFTTEGASHFLLLLGTGVVTATPLILFAAAASRIPLVTLGLLQYLTPVLQLVSGAFILNEEVPLSRWIGFGFVWAALVVLTVDTVRNTRRRRRPVAATEPAG